MRDKVEALHEVSIEVGEGSDAAVLDVKVCPATRHLREYGREIVPCFCQHCYFISEAMAAPAGLTVRIEGGNGVCRQKFLRKDPAIATQNFSQIKEAEC